MADHLVNRETIVSVQAYMIVLCATWRTARGVYDLLCEMVRHDITVKPLLMYGASGNSNDIEVGALKLEHRLVIYILPETSGLVTNIWQCKLKGHYSGWPLIWKKWKSQNLKMVRESHGV